jgi:predicted P-loop ATPase
MREKVILEWSEFDRQFGRDRSDTIKAALRRQVVTYRPPYGRDMVNVPLSCTFWGTTNHQEILPDVTGNRTFWIITVNNKIDCNSVTQQRDLLWQHSINLYLNNYTNWLDTEELNLKHLENVAEFEVTDPWEEQVKSYVEYRLSIDPLEQFEAYLFLDKNAEQIGNSKYPILKNHEDMAYDRASQMRLAKIFTKLGLRKKRVDRIAEGRREQKTVYGKI